MNLKQWVQHVSGKGEKWEVSEECVHTWCVYSKQTNGKCVLPKSEYVRCDPPEEWENVTENCYEVTDRLSTEQSYIGGIASQDHYILFERNKKHGLDFRLTKVNRLHDGPSFIVERRKS